MKNFLIFILVSLFFSLFLFEAQASMPSNKTQLMQMYQNMFNSSNPKMTNNMFAKNAVISMDGKTMKYKVFAKRSMMMQKMMKKMMKKVDIHIIMMLKDANHTSDMHTVMFTGKNGRVMKYKSYSFITYNSTGKIIKMNIVSVPMMMGKWMHGNHQMMMNKGMHGNKMMMHPQCMGGNSHYNRQYNNDDDYYDDDYYDNDDG